MRYLILIALFFSVQANAQLKSYTLTARRDTLNRVDIKGMKQGPWTIHVDELRGERGYEEEGYFLNDKKEGVWKRFSLEGDLIALESYRLGMKHGKCMYFTNAGEPLREESWRAIDPSNPYDTIDIRDVNDPTRVIRSQIIKVEPNAYKHGVWTYYDPSSGTVYKTEEYQMDKIKVKNADLAGDDMAPIDVAGSDSTGKKTVKKVTTKPQAILDYEKKNSGKKKVKVRDGNTGG